MNDLITLDEYKAALGIPLSDTSVDLKIGNAISWASSAIRGLTRRDFAETEDVTPTVRTYTYDGSGFLDVDDFVTGSLEGITVNGVVFGPDDYSAQPDDPNEPVQSWIELTPGLGLDPLGAGFLRNIDTLGYRRLRARTRVEATARWGWAEVPGDVKQAAVWTTASFIENPKPFLSKSVAEVSISYPNPMASEAIPDRAEKLLARYVKVRIAAA